jgi:hypothetical protein
MMENLWGEEFVQLLRGWCCPCAGLPKCTVELCMSNAPLLQLPLGRDPHVSTIEDEIFQTRISHRLFLFLTF